SQHYTALHTLHSFPTRRSSDLECGSMSLQPPAAPEPADRSASPPSQRSEIRDQRSEVRPEPAGPSASPPPPPDACPGSEPVAVRSEEHTSELQSRSDLVCRLLL